MNNKQKRRLTGIIMIVAILAMAIGLVLYALKQNINLFYTPTQLLQAKIQPQQIVRIGGYVKEKSVRFDASGKQVVFVITDRTNEIAVKYNGVLPNLFRDGQGVVVSGKLAENNVLLADQVLAKHDEKYMPWPLAKELQKEKQP